jgi:hypothetical protein
MSQSLSVWKKAYKNADFSKIASEENVSGREKEPRLFPAR